ncbi:MAG: flippase [Candidatus Promineifilaceae bacterium]|nr:flippase [Candidatus Promineifilaceae bacterium]
MDNQPAILTIFNNTAWLSLDKLSNTLISLLVGVWVARYLGPERLGTISYAVAFVAIMVPFAQLGLKDIAIRNIVRSPNSKNEILGTNLILQIIAGLFVALLTILLANALNPDDSLITLLVTIIAMGLLFDPFANTVQYWFHSQVKAKYLVWSNNAILVLTAILRIGLILAGASLVAFAGVYLLHTILLSAALLLAYIIAGEHLRELRFSFERAKELLTDSWPLLFASFAVVIYMKIDQIMLGQMVSKTEVGYYAVAVRLSETWYFIPVALAASVFPSIIRSHQHKDPQIYQKRIQSFYDVVVGISYFIVIPLVLFAAPLVILLFGEEYAQSGSILKVHAWAFIFVSIGVARSRWLIAENLVRFSLMATVLGAIVNIAVNYLLIPRYAGLGAAWASVIAYGVSGYLSSLLSLKTRIAFKQSSLALSFPFRFLLGKIGGRDKV